MDDQKVTINGFAPVLTYAACEWFLIFLMFIDALLSYLLVWFARYCKLQMPCFLCSKLLHPPPLHWRFLLCQNHRSEISSYMSCQNHDNNLAECTEMCDDCLMSFTKTTGPNQDMDRLLLRKLGYDLVSKTHPRTCSCCNKIWKTRRNTQRLVRLGSRGRSNKPNIPIPRNLTRRESIGSLKKMRMPHVDYSELKIHSESESEFLFSDDDAFIHITDHFKTDPKRVHKSRPRKAKNIHVEDSVVTESSMSMPKIEGENQQQGSVEREEPKDVLLTELITMSEARPFPLELPKQDNARTQAQNENEAEESGNSSPSAGEFLSPSADYVIKTQVQVSDAAREERVSVSVANEPYSDVDNGEEEHSSEANENNVVEEYFSNYEYEINRQSEPSTSKDVSHSFVEEQSSEGEDNDYSAAKSHSSNEEDNGESQPLTSENVTATATEEHSGMMPPKPPREESSLEHTDKEDASQVKPQLNHSASVESFVSISSDIEGENLVDILKQQLEHDRRSLRELNKELEEERNASAIATNQAMAMITRLQEEKATLHMEALQYLRMMDEQAEHDVDALEKANDLLADKEKEIQDLEIELEYYRVKYPDEPREEILASMGILENVEDTTMGTPTIDDQQ